MDYDGAVSMARAGRLYPSLILHGGSAEVRRETALALARLLLCDREAPERPCGECRHCRRIAWPDRRQQAFHPDFQILERDLRTVTSVGATKQFLLAAQVAPFEARGQVFVVASAESLSGEAANALLKTLEEPHTSAPRHFMLLAPSRFDLLPTLRSRSLEIYLGGERQDDERVGELAERFGDSVDRYLASKSSAHLLAAADALAAAGGWEDPRAGGPWTLAAAAVLATARRAELSARCRRELLTLAGDLLEAPAIRVRGITAQRVLEGLVARRLGGDLGPVWRP